MSYSIFTAKGNVTLDCMWEEFRKGSELSRGPWVEMSYRVPDWAVGDAVVNALMGGGKSAPPLTCPVSPNLVCNSATVEGRGEYVDFGGGLPVFNLTVVKASYGLRSWEGSNTEDPGGNQSFPNDANPGQPYTFATQSLNYGGETIKLPTNAYMYESDSKPVNVPVITTVGVATMSFTRKFVQTLPTALILSKINKLNDALFFGAPRGQVRFAGARTSKEYLSDGARVQEVEYEFKYRTKDWNQYHREDSNTWDYITAPGDGRPLAYVDLRPLLVV